MRSNKLVNSKKSSILQQLGLTLRIGPSLYELFEWLEENELVLHSKSYELDLSSDAKNILLADRIPVLGVSCARAEKMRKTELDQLKKQRGPHFSMLLEDRKEDWEEIWQEIRHPESSIRDLNLRLMPPDAFAFYRPFHFPPFKEWGIYLITGRILKYCHYLYTSFGLRTFSKETLAVAVLFEVFHHEFFHHMTESTATAIEILCAGLGQTRPIYQDYWAFKHEIVLGEHPHKPLEEALANAYAYNSFSFISRVSASYIDASVKLYQKALEKYWKSEPPGYREAVHYIKGSQVNGVAHLLSMLLASSIARENVPLMTLAQSVFPSGHTALMAKPDIPTYLVGDRNELQAFYELVPAPNEAYTSLFWPGDTHKLDGFIKQKRKEEREAKKRAKSKSTNFSQQSLFR